jgi:hypothetical protein
VSTVYVIVLLAELAMTTATKAWHGVPPPPGSDVTVTWRGKPVFVPHAPKPAGD